LIKKPIAVPKGVKIKIEGQKIHAQGSHGQHSLEVHPAVHFALKDEGLCFSCGDSAKALAGTMYALATNLLHGVDQGFERKLQLVGVGYRAKAKGKDQLSLQLGYSHPVEYRAIKDVTVDTPSATEIVVRGVDKQKVGQVATEIRALRPPEPYKGKGVRYADEAIKMKEAKKK